MHEQDHGPPQEQDGDDDPVRIAVLCIVESTVDFPDAITLMNDKTELFLVSSVIFHSYDSMLSTPQGILHLLSTSASIFEGFRDVNEICECG